MNSGRGVRPSSLSSRSHERNHDAHPRRKPSRFGPIGRRRNPQKWPRPNLPANRGIEFPIRPPTSILKEALRQRPRIRGRLWSLALSTISSFFSPWCGRRFAQCASCLAGVSRARILRVSGSGTSTADAATMHPRTRASYGGCHRSVTISPRVSPTAMPRATSKSCRLRMTSEVPLLRMSITAPVEISETMKFVR